MSLFDRTEAEELYANVMARREQMARAVGAAIDLDYATGANYDLLLRSERRITQEQ